MTDKEYVRPRGSNEICEVLEKSEAGWKVKGVITEQERTYTNLTLLEHIWPDEAQEFLDKYKPSAQ